MYARVATFQSDPSKIDGAIEMVRAEVESGNTPEGLEGAKMLMLVDRESGKSIGITLFESELSPSCAVAARNLLRKEYGVK